VSSNGRAFTLIDTRNHHGEPRGLCDLSIASLWDSEKPTDIDLARAICQRCPIRESCLTNAINEEGSATRHVRAGIRGGLDGAERETRWRKTHRTPTAA
jgi:hypothetical protein